MAKIFILAGEASGDLHGSYLIKELLNRDSKLIIKAWGGHKMNTAGAEILRSLEHLAFMGFTEVLKNFSTILENFSLCKKQISEFKPDVIVFIDYPGFNLRMAKWANTKGYKTIQYIAPAAWAWKENRVKKIKKYVDELLVILPFEKAFFAKHNIDAHFVGHPLIEEIDNWKPDLNFSLPDFKNSKTHIGLFPGSRLQEIKLILPKMLEYVKLKSNFQFYIAVPDNLNQQEYLAHINGIENVHLILSRNYDLLNNIELAIVSSGTATLEVALFEVPQVVCYQTNTISFQIAKKLIKTKFISLVNLIHGEEVVKELIQEEFNLENLQATINVLLNEDAKARLAKDYRKIKTSLSKENASKNAAEIILI